MIPIRDTIKARRTPVITFALIIANIVAFIYELRMSPVALEQTFHVWGVVPARYFHPQWAAGVGYPKMSFYPFFTSMFLHGGWFHLISNMWALWLFGDNVEDRMGHIRFLIFYILCGILAGVLHIVIHPGMKVPTIGASGAIAGVMGAYFLLFPFSRILVLMPVFFYPLFFEIPAVFYLFFWFLTQFWSGTLSLGTRTSDVGGIAFWAHVGGFVAGLILVGWFHGKKKGKTYIYPA
ncbi:rhomboid family intramembrane serine protease [Candidatus Sumerlaeota bacterium]|nr:rhomboid family intramembrane serine protease [Candidatus Sumerlaeota bacterium]